jgi:hypothetical protein
VKCGYVTRGYTRDSSRQQEVSRKEPMAKRSFRELGKDSPALKVRDTEVVAIARCRHHVRAKVIPRFGRTIVVAANGHAYLALNWHLVKAIGERTPQFIEDVEHGWTIRVHVYGEAIWVKAPAEIEARSFQRVPRKADHSWCDGCRCLESIALN